MAFLMLKAYREDSYDNRLCFSYEKILENVQNIQFRNGLKKIKELKNSTLLLK